MRNQPRKSRTKRGQSLVEYVALTALVAIVSIGTLKVFGSKVRTRLNQITNTFDRSLQQGLRSRPGLDPSDDAGEPHSRNTRAGRTPGFTPVSLPLTNEEAS